MSLISSLQSWCDRFCLTNYSYYKSRIHYYSQMVYQIFLEGRKYRARAMWCARKLIRENKSWKEGWVWVGEWRKGSLSWKGWPKFGRREPLCEIGKRLKLQASLFRQWQLSPHPDGNRNNNRKWIDEAEGKSYRNVKYVRGDLGQAHPTRWANQTQPRLFVLPLRGSPAPPDALRSHLPS